jgi:hypothetical protein
MIEKTRRLMKQKDAIKLPPERFNRVAQAELVQVLLKRRKVRILDREFAIKVKSPWSLQSMLSSCNWDCHS